MHGRYTGFTINDPKTRRIHKALVADRIIHQLLVNILEPMFEPRFIYDSFSCRRGKGTHAGVKRLRLLLGKASRNNTKTVYVLKCDIRQFFASVDAEILRRLIARRVASDEILWLVDEILASFSPGIPLGNVTSQLFANIYLHELDWYVKQTLQIKYYVRYCDDFVIVCASRSEADRRISMIGRFLKATLKLELHPNKVSVRTFREGIDFLGYVLKPGAMLIRTKTRARMLARVTSENKSSYLGVCSHANAYELSSLVRSIAH